VTGTEVAQPGSNVPALPDNFDPMVGMEDVTSADLTIPRLRIKHKEAVFRDALTNQDFEYLDCIVLGTIKQRVMFHEIVEDGDVPQCKSTDYDQGYPNISEEAKPSNRFPWKHSNFDRENFQPDSAGRVVLPCSSCIFKDWNKTSQAGKEWKKPPCNEQHTYVILYTPDEGETYMPALVTFSKTGITPSKNYISGFYQRRKPMFTVHTRIELQVAKRGDNQYCTPKFKSGAATDPEMWGEWSDQLRNIRDFLRRPPRSNVDEDEEAVVPSNENVGPQQASATPAPTHQASQPAPPAQQSPPAPTAAPSQAAAAPAASPVATGGTAVATADDDEDDVPF
jgi:hypothetical protein